MNKETKLIKCACGLEVKKTSMREHLKSQRHFRFMMFKEYEKEQRAKEIPGCVYHYVGI